MQLAADKDKKSGKDSDDLTPEEKLFRAVVSDSGDFDDFMDEEDEYQDDAGAGFKRAVRGIVDGIANFFSKIGGPLKSSGPSSTATADRLHRPAWLDRILSKIKLKNINQTVGIIVILVVFYLFFDIAFGNKQPFKSLLGKQAGKEISLIQGKGPQPIKPLNYYLDPTQQRNVFKKVVPPPPPVIEQGPRIQLVQEVPVNIKLVGVSWDATEYVAMIEIAEEGHARFVRKGETLPGNILIEEITETAVTMSRDGQSWDLT